MCHVGCLVIRLPPIRLNWMHQVFFAGGMGLLHRDLTGRYDPSPSANITVSRHVELTRTLYLNGRSGGYDLHITTKVWLSWKHFFASAFESAHSCLSLLYAFLPSYVAPLSERYETAWAEIHVLDPDNKSRRHLPKVRGQSETHDQLHVVYNKVDLDNDSLGRDRYRITWTRLGMCRGEQLV